MRVNPVYAVDQCRISTLCRSPPIQKGSYLVLRTSYFVLSYCLFPMSVLTLRTVSASGIS
jgi:hypothetical protein